MASQPQTLSEAGGGFCVETGQRIRYRAPQRPFWIAVWQRYRHLGRQQLRRVATGYCHLCGAAHASTYASVVCDDCKPGL